MSYQLGDVLLQAITCDRCEEVLSFPKLGVGPAGSKDFRFRQVGFGRGSKSKLGNCSDCNSQTSPAEGIASVVSTLTTASHTPHESFRPYHMLKAKVTLSVEVVLF